MRTIDNQININEISSSDKYDVKCNIEHDLESAEAVEVRARMRRRGASSILETAAQQSSMDALCVPSAGRVTLIRR